MKYSKEWREIVGRLGRWIDFDNDYKTMNITFMESVWHVFKTIYDRGLVYRSSKVMPYSTACNTVLPNFEAGSNYKDDTRDPSVLVTFPLLEDPKVKLVAWTTTPWTLPSNMALNVHPEFEYVKVRDLKKDQIYVVLAARLEAVAQMAGIAEFEVLESFKGEALRGKQYEPLFDYYAHMRAQGCFQVLTATYVTDKDGTGVVHSAPAFGEEDFNSCVKAGIVERDRPPCPIDESGRFKAPVTDYEGLYIKTADNKIKADLKERGRLLFQGTIVHSYPFCWRSDTPLIYRAVQSWFIEVT